MMLRAQLDSVTLHCGVKYLSKDACEQQAQAMDATNKKEEFTWLIMK
jgi:hypothetical protein